jgi:hypothetical protein
MGVGVHSETGRSSDSSGWRLLLAGAVGALVALSLGLYGNAHDPASDLSITLGFKDTITMKVWLATLALVFACVQLGSALWLFGRLPAGAPPRWLGACIASRAGWRSWPACPSPTTASTSWRFRTARRGSFCTRWSSDERLAWARLAGRRRLSSDSLLRQPERGSLGVLADGPCLPRVNHAPAERFDPLQRFGDVAYREVGQGEGIAGSTSASMDADRRGSRVRLPALSLSSLASLQLDAEEFHPEATGALCIVCGKFNE